MSVQIQLAIYQFKKMASIVAMALSVMLVAACGSTTPEKKAESKPAVKTESKAAPAPAGKSKILVAYYSASGNTENVAKAIASAKGADLLKLEPQKPYSNADLDYRNGSSRVSQEHNDPARKVPLKNAKPANWKDYDTVFVGYPIWWGIAAWPVDEFIKANDFTGKTVIPFCTSASSGMGDSGNLLKTMAGGKGKWLEGRRFGEHPSENDVKSWANGLKL